MKRILVLAILFHFLIPARHASAETKSVKPPKKLPQKAAKAAAPDAKPTTTATPAPAQKSGRVPIDANTMRINYGFPAWNKDPKAVDSASILMREGATGRVVQIHLVEDAPNSSIFSGLFSINWQNIDKLQVEFYIPPQELLQTLDGMKKLSAMIANKELRRKPFLVRKTTGSNQSIEIFDSVDQAQLALKAYRAEQQLQTLQGLQQKSFPSDQQLDVAHLAQTQAQRAAAAKALAERVRLSQVELRKLQDYLQKFMALTPQDRAAHKKQADALTGEALKLYREGKFAESTTKFEQAIELDPEDHTYFFQYAVALYRTEAFNRSLIYLQLADGSGVNEGERQFYNGLDYFGLKDYDSADAALGKVLAGKESDLTGTAQFYKGVIKFEQKRWEESQASFQAVLDNSKDTTLDKQAETYIEQILRIRQFEAERAKKWTLSTTIAEMADSNILLSSDSALDQGTASNSLGYRSLFLGSLRYRPVYDEVNEFAAQVDVITMYTLDKSFASSQALRNADPTVMTVSAPWSFKSTAFGYGYKLDLAPGYESIWMSVENNENKVIIDSYILNVNNLVVMSNTWFANWNVESRKDNAHLIAAVGDNDANAIKVKLLNANTFILNEGKTKFGTAEAGYTMNQALGRDTTYNRIDVSAGYLQPFYWDTVANAKLGYYLLTYPNHTKSRVDSNIMLTLGSSKKLNDTMSAGLIGSYDINNSTVDTSAYKKWTMMVTLSAVVGL